MHDKENGRSKEKLHCVTHMEQEASQQLFQYKLGS